jgi:Ca-activated chloride channel family protein
VKFAYDFTSLPVILLALACGLLVVVFATMLVLAAMARRRAIVRFGDAPLVERLGSYDATVRRTTKGVLLVVALVAAFAALARPQFGRGTRLIPATNVDVVLVLDYSKSMYARDVTPSRIARAKAEVARLIQELSGARFAAVAFAGEPMSFPLTSDGAAIAQFFRQLEPNDMPIGGTATARALERARDLLARDPKSKDHVRVIVLVTDGEDLEGDPVAVAKAAAEDGIRIDVVQIGGRAPEVIPDVGPDGKVQGIRRDESGKPLTTSLSAEGEAQLAKVAELGGGVIVRSEGGDTGIDRITKGLSRMMREELAEKVETVYAEEYGIPLALAILLLVVEAFVAEAPIRKRRRAADAAAYAPLGMLTLVLAASGTLAIGCGWDPKRPFDRESPEVNRAVAALDAGDAGVAEVLLEDYLSTGPCEGGNIGTPERLQKRPDGTFDLGLALFQMAESFGARFGEEQAASDGDDPLGAAGGGGLGGGGGAGGAAGERAARVACALRVVSVIAENASLPAELRARARYLEGNLHFLNGAYGEAVAAYDRALVIAPGEVDGGDPVGRDAAWNRAVALRRRDEQNRDGGADASAGDDGGPPDGGSDGGDGGSDDRDDGGSSPPPDGGDANDGGGAPPDAGQDPSPDAGGGDDAGAPPAPPPDAGAEPPPPSRTSQDDRILDQLENAPTVQQEAARKQAQRRRVRVSEDK